MPEDDKVERTASSPIKGSLRDAIRTFVAFLVAFGFTWLGGKIPGVDLAGMQEGLIVILTSAILAFAGKAFRNKGVSVGEIL